MSSEKINWQKTSSKSTGDWIAKPNISYVLRAEKMSDYWWWCVYFMGDVVEDSWDDAETITNRTKAFAKAEAVFNKHFKEFGK